MADLPPMPQNEFTPVLFGLLFKLESSDHDLITNVADMRKGMVDEPLFEILMNGDNYKNLEEQLAATPADDVTTQQQICWKIYQLMCSFAEEYDIQPRR